MSCPEHAKMAEAVNAKFGNTPGNFDLTTLPPEIKSLLEQMTNSQSQLAEQQPQEPYVPRKMPFQFFPDIVSDEEQSKWQMWQTMAGKKLWQLKEKIQDIFEGSVLADELSRPNRPWNQWLATYSPAVAKQRQMDDALYAERDRVWSKEEIYEAFDYDVEAANHYIKRWESYLQEKKQERLAADRNFEEPDDARNEQQLLVFTKQKEAKYLYTRSELMSELVLLSFSNVELSSYDELRERYFTETRKNLRIAATDPTLPYTVRTRYLRQADLLEPEVNPLLEETMLTERRMLDATEKKLRADWRAMMRPEGFGKRQKYALQCLQDFAQKPQIWNGLFSKNPNVIKKPLTNFP